MTDMNDLQKNYHKAEDIAKEIQNVDLENFLDFDSNGSYEFALCEKCDGPLLGHIEVKCSSLEGLRYERQIVKSFENWLKRITGFREAVQHRNMKKDEKQVIQITETVKTIIEGIEKKNKANTTQLVKPRFPPLWSGQDFDRWKIEIEKWFDNNKASDEEKYIDLIESLKKN